MQLINPVHGSGSRTPRMATVRVTNNLHDVPAFMGRPARLESPDGILSGSGTRTGCPAAGTGR